MDRKQSESVELFRAYTVEELREQQQKALVVGGKFSSPYRGDDSSSYGGPIKTD